MKNERPTFEGTVWLNSGYLKIGCESCRSYSVDGECRNAFLHSRPELQKQMVTEGGENCNLWAAPQKECGNCHFRNDKGICEKLGMLTQPDEASCHQWELADWLNKYSA